MNRGQQDESNGAQGTTAVVMAEDAPERRFVNPSCSAAETPASAGTAAHNTQDEVAIAAAPTSFPRDKILCEQRYQRYVVACMSNCAHPHYCAAFWQFFERRGLTPVQYYNVDGIGERVMRRIVIDCDRCGRKDVGEVFALYTPEGEGESFRIPDPVQQQRTADAGYPGDDVWKFVVGWLTQLEREKQWIHLCGGCYQKLCDCTATVLNVKRAARGKDVATDAPTVLPVADGASMTVSPPPEQTERATLTSLEPRVQRRERLQRKAVS